MRWGDYRIIQEIWEHRECLKIRKIMWVRLFSSGSVKTNLKYSNFQMSAWASSKYTPGQFLGSTGANLLSAKELAGWGNKAYAKKVWKAFRSFYFCNIPGHFLKRESKWMRRSLWNQPLLSSDLLMSSLTNNSTKMNIKWKNHGIKFPFWEFYSKIFCVKESILFYRKALLLLLSVSIKKNYTLKLHFAGLLRLTQNGKRLSLKPHLYRLLQKLWGSFRLIVEKCLVC